MRPPVIREDTRMIFIELELCNEFDSSTSSLEALWKELRRLAR
jgi:hypothetical protein